MTTSSVEPQTELRIPILRSTRPELAREFYNGLLGADTTVLGSDRASSTPDTWGVVEAAEPGATSRWYPHIVTENLATARVEIAERGGVTADASDPFDHLLLTAPDHSQIIVTTPEQDQRSEMARDPNRPFRVMLELCTRSIDDSSDFYSDILELTQVPVPEDPYGYRVFFAGDIGMAGAVDMTTFFLKGTESHWIPYFHVTDIDESLHTAAAYGARVTVPTDASMFGCRYAVLTDPTGATFGIREYPAGGIFGYFSATEGRFLPPLGD